MKEGDGLELKRWIEKWCIDVLILYSKGEEILAVIVGLGNGDLINYSKLQRDLLEECK